MNFRQRRERRVEVNITPLIDVVFLLLIFFMVTTTFKEQSALEIELPEAASGEVQPAAPLELVVSADGRYFIGEKALVNPRRETLHRTLAERTAGIEKPALVVRADGRAPHEAVVRALDVAAELGIERVRIATVRTGEQG